MNRENIESAITVMRRIKDAEKTVGRKLLDMSWFVNGEDRPLTAATDEFAIIHSCGTTCCVSGWLALSPEFQKLGIKRGKLGEATSEEYYWDTHSGYLALAKIFDLPADRVFSLLYNLNIVSFNEVLNVMNHWLKYYQDYKFEYNG